MASTPPPSTSETATVTILNDYVDSLARLRKEEEDDPHFSLDQTHRKRRELAQACLLRLNQARTEDIAGLLEEAVRALKSQGISDASAVSVEELRAVLASSSQPLAELLRLQLVSQEEEGLYRVCRIAWDHAHVGERLVRLLEEGRRQERKAMFKRHIEGVRRGLLVIRSCYTDQDESDDGVFVRALEGDVMDNLTRLVAGLAECSEERVLGETVDQNDETRQWHQEAIDQLHAQVQKATIDCVVRSVVFEKGGLPKPRSEVRLRALLGATAGLDAIDHVSMRMTAERLAELVFTSSVRKVLVTFGDPSKHPVGYREKVVLKVETCLKDELLLGDTFWVTSVGKLLWHMIAAWYVEEWDRHREQSAKTSDSLTMKRMMFAKKLEGKTMGLFGFSNAGVDGDNPYTSLAAVADERTKEILNRRRADTVCAVRDLLFAVGSAKCTGEYAYREVSLGDMLVPWLHGGVDQAPQPSDFGSQSTLGPEVLNELQSVDGDTPLACAETRLQVLESHAMAVAHIGAALQDNSALLTDGQYAQFVDTLAEDVASLLVAMAQLRGEEIVESIEALRRATLQYMSCIYVARSLCLVRFGCGKANERPNFIITPLPALGNACRRIAMLAEEILGTGLEAFRQQYLIEHLASLTLWRQVVDIKDIIAKKKSVSRVLHAFGQLKNGLDNVSERMVATVMKTLIGSLTDTIANSIFDLRDISEELSETIPQVLDDLCDGLGGILAPIKCASLEKLTQLCRVMRLTSGEIVTDWQDGVLGQLFDKEEIVSLIGALFELTPMVSQNLARLGE